MDVTANPNMDVTNVTQAPGVVEAPSSSVIQKELPVREVEKPIKPAQISRSDVEEMVDALKDLTATLQTSLNFSVHEKTNDIVVKIVEKGTNKIIRQIPPEELLKLHEKMQDLTGYLFDVTG